MPDIQLWTGRAHRLLGPLVEAIGALHRQGEPCLWLVPEQFTLQGERELLTRLNLEGFFTIDVLSPSRLSERVLAAAGSDQRLPLSGPGRQMAVSQALERCEESLVYYQSSVHRQGFVQKIASLLTDMKQGGLTPEALGDYAASVQDSAEKLKDVAAIFAAYERVLEGRFSDGDDRMRYVAARLPQSKLMEGQNVFVYGFDTLPESLTSLLASIAPLCKRLTVALVCDGESAPDGDLYLPMRQSIGRFMKRLEEAGLSATLRPLPPAPLDAAPAICHLDRALFAHPPAALQEAQHSVFLSQHQSPFEEASWAARHILRLAGQGTDLERIALLYPDQNGYAFAVNAALRDADIPFYTDQKLPATSHGLVRYLLCSLRAMAGGYREEDMLGMLKSGYAPLSFEEACRLENYARAYGVRLNRWLGPFTKGDKDYAAACEELRARVMKPLLRARAALVAARDTHASLEAVFGLLQDAGAYETLKAEEEALLENGLQVRAGQNSQVWETVLTILDQLYALQNGARVPLKHIAGRLESGFSAVSLASLPPAAHMLHVGTLGHYLSGEMEAVFLLGLNDGALSRSTESLLTEAERAQAQAATGAFLGMTDESRALFARLDLKRAMTLPSRLLFLSHAKTSPEGTALRPLSLLSTLQRRILGDLPQSPVPPAELPLTSTQALAELSLRLRAFAEGAGEAQALPPPWRARLKDLLARPDTSQAAMRLLSALSSPPQARPLPPQQARALFGDEVLSVSRLEEFAQCPFKHFVEYGLRPQPVKEWKVEAIDTGNFYHAGLDNFAKLARHYAAFPHIPDQEAEALADAAVSPLLDELMQGPMGDGAMSQATFERARQTLRRAAVTITRHLAAGRFSLDRTEASFGYPGGMPPIVLALPDGSQVMLRGKIDRVDRYDTPEAAYLRVIDYKSSRQDVDAARTWWGLQLQLLLYLDICVASTPKALPAGAFYFYVADPLVESDTDLQAVVEGELRELLQLRGIALADVEILRAMDEEELSIVLPKMLDRQGQLKSTAKAVDLPQLQSLLAHAREMATTLAQGIFSGETGVSPVQTGSATACDYCDYRAICGFDPASPDSAYRSVPRMDMAALRQRLSGEEGDAPVEAMEFPEAFMPQED